MASAIKCDRCEKFEAGTGITFTDAVGIKKVLCTECKSSFDDWWEKGKTPHQK